MPPKGCGIVARGLAPGAGTSDNQAVPTGRRKIVSICPGQLPALDNWGVENLEAESGPNI